MCVPSTPGTWSCSPQSGLRLNLRFTWSILTILLQKKNSSALIRIDPQRFQLISPPWLHEKCLAPHPLWRQRQPINHPSLLWVNHFLDFPSINGDHCCAHCCTVKRSPAQTVNIASCRAHGRLLTQINNKQLCILFCLIRGLMPSLRILPHPRTSDLPEPASSEDFWLAWGFCLIWGLLICLSLPRPRTSDSPEASTLSEDFWFAWACLIRGHLTRLRHLPCPPKLSIWFLSTLPHPRSCCK